MTNPHTLRIFTNGGIVSPEELRKIIHVARLCNCAAVFPGSRQELYLQVEENYLAMAEKELAALAMPYTIPVHNFENIVTSFAALDIFPTTAWLLGDTYLDILDTFTYQPRLKINIADPLQNLVPLFTGELNFIASAYPRYWYLYLNFTRFGKRQIWPLLIDGDDLAKLAGLIEETYFQENPENIQALFAIVNEKFTGRSRNWEHELQLPVDHFPLIEGIHKSGSSYWLGIYRRNQSFSLELLEAIHRLSIQSKIGKICLTPHKTLLIKDIREEELLHWEKLLGMHSINIQHSALELNWQLPDLDKEAIQLKNAWVRELEDKEVRTAGVSFAILTQPLDVAASVLIERKTQQADTNLSEQVYSVFHTVDFSIHQSHWQLFAEDVLHQNLTAVLIQVSQAYYAQLGKTAAVTEPEASAFITQTHEVYQCPDCLTVYDPVYGDNVAGIPAGVSFQQLPGSYVCSLCEAPKSTFIVAAIPERSLG